MAALAVAGVSFPVSIDSLKLSLEDVGTAGRNQRGHRVLERRRSKWVLDFALSPCPLDEAMMYRSLVLGDGERWNTLASAYGAKGLLLTGTGGWTGSGGGNPHNGNGVFRLTTGQTMVVPGRFYSQAAVSTAAAAITGATLIGWRRDDAAGTYRIFGVSWRAFESAVVSKREKLGSLGSSGAAQNYTGTETFSVASGNLTITAPGSGGPWSYSNLTVYPWFMPQAQVDQLMEGQAASLYTLPALPRVYVTTDLLPTEQHKAAPTGLFQSSLICHGEVSDLEVMPLARDGAWSTTECVLSGRLIEV